jgi:hypothetical protein
MVTVEHAAITVVCSASYSSLWQNPRQQNYNLDSLDQGSTKQLFGARLLSERFANLRADDTSIGNVFP